jgi:polysaccharide export outer membrane protein
MAVSIVLRVCTRMGIGASRWLLEAFLIAATVTATAALGGCGASLSNGTFAALASDKPKAPSAALGGSAPMTAVPEDLEGATQARAPKYAKPAAGPSLPITTEALPPPSSSATVAAPKADGYRIGPQDILDFSVFKVPDLQRSVVVAETGTVNLPLIGEVRAADRTAAELEREVARKLGEKYLQNPQVSFIVREYNSQRITLEGAVKKPGVYPLRGKTTLLQVVATAEGFTDIGDATVVIFRQEEGKKLAAKFDVADIRAGTTPDPVLQAGDTIVAPTSASKEAFASILKALPLATFAALAL